MYLAWSEALRKAMRRRDFIKSITGSAVAWPHAAHAQQAAVPVVGFVYPGTSESDADIAAAFRKGLGETGYIDGANVAVEYRWAGNDTGKLPTLVEDLVHRQVAVIATGGNSASIVAAAVKTIPVVFAIGFDPVQSGIVSSLSRPSANATGITTLNTELGAKWLGLFHDLLPNATRFAVLSNPDDVAFAANATPAALARGWQIEILYANTDDEIDKAFASLVEKRIEALMIVPGGLFRRRLVKLATLATRQAIPAIYPIPQFAEAGGLMSYGTNFVDIFRQAGVYVGRILKGAKPADLPVLQPTKFEFVVNLSTAKALGITFPSGLLAIVDRVIE
jgi:putative tryptophan/tyrosine transport system substrate-binding protein